MEEAEVDIFELRLKLTKLLNSLGTPNGARNVFSFCTRYANLCDELFPCLVDAFKEEPKLQRHIISVFEALSEAPMAAEYRRSLVVNFRQLVEFYLTSSPNLQIKRPLIKAFKTFLSSLDGENRVRLGDLESRLLEAVGISDADQAIFKRKQAALELIERERESHKALREACWARKEGEVPLGEFANLFSHSQPFDSSDYAILDRNVLLFCAANKLDYCKPNTIPIGGGGANGQLGDTLSSDPSSNPPYQIASKRPRYDSRRKMNLPADNTTSSQSNLKAVHPHTVLLIEVEEAFIKLDRFMEDRDPSIRFLADRLDQCILELGKACFFYKDLRDFMQPHVYYYQDDDDGRELESYDFAHDPLSREVRERGKPTGSFYRERAFRHRLSAERYDHPSLLDGLLDTQLRKQWTETYQDLDHRSNNFLSLSQSCLSQLITLYEGEGDEPNVIAIAIVHGHLSTALASLLVFGLERLFPSRFIYSTRKYGTEWVFDQIAKKYGNSVDYCVIGDTRKTGEAAKKFGWSLYPARNAADIEGLARSIARGTPQTMARHGS